MSVAVIIITFSAISPAWGIRGGNVWGTRPLLSYFALTASLAGSIQNGAQLSPQEFYWVEEIAEAEAASLRKLYERSQVIIAKEGLSLAQKRQIISWMGYNEQVKAILYLTDWRLRRQLSKTSYERLINWIEQHWRIEHARHGIVGWRFESPGKAPRTYEVFATRYESKGGAYVAALPDKCLKFANGGLQTCSDQGYHPGVGYSIVIRYKDTIGALVGEAGPWNIDDNYWSSVSDPQPRRMFKDLPLGMPEAQAAYFNGYNGGLDQYGRKVTAPFAIDLAFKLADDIGLPARKNDWVTVSYLWTENWDGKSAQVGKPTGSGTAATTAPLQIISQVQTATPAADGSIMHNVQAGETLWTIAAAYHVNVTRIQNLNNLGQKIVIYEGQNLVIKEAGPTWTPVNGSLPETSSTEIYGATISPSPENFTNTSDPNRSVPPSTITPVPARFISTDEAEITEGIATKGAIRESSSEVNTIPVEQIVLIGVLILAGGGAALTGIGWFLNRRQGDQDS